VSSCVVSPFEHPARAQRSLLPEIPVLACLGYHFQSGGVCKEREGTQLVPTDFPGHVLLLWLDHGSESCIYVGAVLTGIPDRYIDSNVTIAQGRRVPKAVVSNVTRARVPTRKRCHWLAKQSSPALQYHGTKAKGFDCFSHTSTHLTAAGDREPRYPRDCDRVGVEEDRSDVRG
jgi:hypothetical protein